MSTTEVLLTAEEYARMPDEGRVTELVRGRVIEMNPPTPRHGQVCFRVARVVAAFAEDQGFGHVVTNDSGVITERQPDTVRGADVAYYSYAKVPKGPLSDGYLNVPPDIVFEVLSPSDRWSEIHLKVGEYLDAGVAAVCVLDSSTERAHLFYRDKPPVELSANEELTFPEQLGELRVTVRKLFEG